MKKLLMLVTALTLVFAVAGCKDDSKSADDALVEEAKTALLLTDINEVTSDLILPTSGLHSSVITWASGDTDFLGNDGAVTRPESGEANEVITLTATITIGKSSDTKEFVIRVIAAVPTVDVTIAEFNSSTVSVDDDIVVTGVIFGIVEGAGMQIYDGTGFVYVFNGSQPIAVLGDTVKVTGQKTIYYGLPEVDTVTSIEILSSGDTQPAYEVTSVVDLFDEDPFDTAYWSKPITVTGLLKVVDDNVVLVTTDANNMSYDIVVYYKSFADQIVALKALTGKVVTVDVIVYGYHDGLGAWRVTVAEDATISSVDATDTVLADYEASQIDLGLIDIVTDDVVLNTTGTMAGTTIAWASDTPASVSTTGVVVRATGSDTTVVLTATVTVGSTTATREFTLIVKDTEYAIATITVAEALATADAGEFVVEGTVAAFNGSSATIIQDVDGTAIVIYGSNFATDNSLAIGDLIIVRGAKDTFFGLHEIVTPVLVKIVSSGNDVTTFTDVTVAQFTADMPGYQGKIVTLTGLKVVDMDSDAKPGYIVVADTAGNEIMFYAGDIPYAESMWSLDYMVGEITAMVYDVYFTVNRIIILEYPALTDAEAVEFVSSEFIMASSTMSDLTLPLLDDDFAVVISWASDTPDVISTTGVVVQPAAGTADATVILTATFTKESATEVETYTITVPQIVLGEAAVLFFSEIIEGSSYNKAIELYNSGDVPIDLSAYTIIENHGGYAITTVLSGSIASGDVFVICNDQLDTGTALDTNCDVKLTGGDDVPNFNGDDSLQLLHNDVVVDQFIAEADAGSDTAAKDIYAEHTFVRKATVVEGVLVFDMTEWTTYDQNDFTHIGSHTYTPTS